MKKILSIFLSTIMIVLTINQFSVSASTTEQYTYINDDGTEIQYYLDDNDMPYNYKNGEKIYLLIPVGSCVVTDEVLIKELNDKLADVKNSQITRAAPTNYYSLRQYSVDVNSNVYTKAMDLNTADATTTYLYKYPQHPIIRVRTADLKKPNIFSSKKVTITVYSYVDSTGVWLKSTQTGVNATGTLGQGFKVTTIHNYFFVQVTQSNDLVSFTINVWTSLYGD